MDSIHHVDIRKSLRKTCVLRSDNIILFENLIQFTRFSNVYVGYVYFLFSVLSFVILIQFKFLIE
jgi:hypothetical protein